MADFYFSDSLEARFLDQVVFTRATGCWIWTGSGKGGSDTLHRYGAFQVDGVSWFAHRLSHVLFKGPIPDDLCVLHECDIPICVNPVHLRLGTRLDNNADRDSKGRQAKRDRHGSRLHPKALHRGESHPQAKLAEAKALEILRRFKNGERPVNLAREFKVSRRSVADLVNRKTWRHLIPPSTEG